MHRRQPILRACPQSQSRPQHRPQAGETLVGLGCLVVELADETLAGQDTESARALVELAMSVLHTAAAIEPKLEAEMDRARLRLREVTESVLHADPAGAGADGDPDSQWPYRVV